MENRYIFEIQAHDSQLDSDSYLGGRDVNIIREEEDGMPPNYLFTSVHLNVLKDPKEVWSRGLGLLALYNGSRNLLYNARNSYSNPFSYRFTRLWIWEAYQDITPSNYPELIQAFPFDINLPTGNKLAYPDPTDYYDQVIRIATKEPEVLSLLLQLGNGLDWVNLYSILDSLKTFSGGKGKKHFEAVAKSCGYTLDGEIHAFTGTANNFGFLGVAARHGEKNWGIPQSTVTLKEGQEIILNLCRAYLKLVYSIP